MAKFNGFPTDKLHTVEQAYKASREGLEKLVNDLYKGTQKGTTFDTYFTKYMGTGSTSATKESISYLVDCIKAMNAKITSLTFKVYYDANYTSGNAMMASYTSVYNGNKLTVLDIQDLETIQTNAGGSRMTIGPSFFTQDMYKIDAQCCIESFLHELSHHAGGSIDDTNGGECYGLTGVNRLKSLGCNRAVRNAENIAFFCMGWVKRVN